MEEKLIDISESFENYIESKNILIKFILFPILLLLEDVLFFILILKSLFEEI